jgi:hypothetical protein
MTPTDAPHSQTPATHPQADSFAKLAVACGVIALPVGALFAYAVLPVALAAIGLGIWAAVRGQSPAMAWTATVLGVVNLGIAALFFALTSFGSPDPAFRPAPCCGPGFQACRARCRDSNRFGVRGHPALDNRSRLNGAPTVVRYVDGAERNVR